MKGEKVGFGWAASPPTQTLHPISAHVGRIGHKANYVWINFSKFIKAHSLYLAPVQVVQQEAEQYFRLLIDG